MSFDRRFRDGFQFVSRPWSSGTRVLVGGVTAAVVLIVVYLVGVHLGKTAAVTRNDKALAAATASAKAALSRVAVLEASRDSLLKDRAARDLVYHTQDSARDALQRRAKTAHGTITAAADKLPPNIGAQVLAALATLDSANAANLETIAVLKADTTDLGAALRASNAALEVAKAEIPVLLKADSLCTDRANGAEDKVEQARSRSLWVTLGSTGGAAIGAAVGGPLGAAVGSLAGGGTQWLLFTLFWR